MTAAKGLAEFWTILMVQCGRVPAEKHQRDSNLDIISLILCVAKYKTSEERSRTLGRHRTRHQMGSIYNMWGRLAARLSKWKRPRTAVPRHRLRRAAAASRRAGSQPAVQNLGRRGTLETI